MSEVSNQPQAKYLRDYRAPDYTFESIDLVFDLSGEKTTVETLIKVLRIGGHNRPLVLDGDALQLDEVAVDDVPLTSEQYQQDSETLTIFSLPASFSLSTKVTIDPANNTSLEGLYKTDGAFCTQCEAEGFRHITYFLDRPDVLCKYRTKIIGDKKTLPQLLSNGNKIDSGELPDGKHWVLWEDPFNKPSYLFALVAGDFDLLEDNFTTGSGRSVKLELYVDKGNLNKADHAMASLKKAMRWDEETFGLEYDLDIYMVVAVDFFNMGAMENKGLNVFNSRCVLANPQTATDNDFHQIESVIGHEYFHNWTGNRVTCRDWFQLSLKEGLTVFRDQQFSADMGSEVVNRIAAVKIIRTMQFAEDASPMSHPIRPEKVIEMNNFYTVTVYDKGAEVIRMMYNLLGAEGFRQGMDLYFERHDGTAVTCDDFVAAMEDASGFDLQQFRRWYSQSGTPVLKVSGSHDSQAQTYTLDVEQLNPPTKDQDQKQPLHIPFDVELLSESGETLPLLIDGQPIDAMLSVTEAQNRFVFSAIVAPPVPVLLRNFSAPVKVEYQYTDEQLLLLISHAGDEFSRWDAAQTLYLNKVKQYIAQPEQFSLSESYITAFTALLTDSSLDKALVAEIITLPSFETIAGNFNPVDIDSINQGLDIIAKQMAVNLYLPLLNCYQANVAESFDASQQAVGQRALKNACLALLTRSGETAVDDLLTTQFNNADNMTDTLAVLSACNGAQHPQFEGFMAAFEQRWSSDVLVMDKWLSLHGRWPGETVYQTIEGLYQHKVFNIENPNRVRSLLNGFVQANPKQFHNINGKGYQLLTDMLIKLNSINPQTAARLVTPLLAFKRYDAERQALIKTQLQRLADLPNLSKDLFEKVSQALS